jgi:ribosomal protein S18 acetylase RimI-like enzyme
MKTPASIRVATMADYDVLCELFELLDEHHRAAEPEIYRQPEGPRRTKERIAFLLNGETGTIYVGEDTDGAVVGFVNVLVQEQPEIPVRAARKYVEIANLVVRPAARRSGVALSLVAAAAEWARCKGFPTVELQVHEFNDAALKFFERAGFHTSKRQMTRAV